jgi:hypothetical protein
MVDIIINGSHFDEAFFPGSPNTQDIRFPNFQFFDTSPFKEVILDNLGSGRHQPGIFESSPSSYF